MINTFFSFLVFLPFLSNFCGLNHTHYLLVDKNTGRSNLNPGVLKNISVPIFFRYIVGVSEAKIWDITAPVGIIQKKL